MDQGADINHKQFLASLSDEQRRELNTRSDGPALRHLAVYVCLLIVTGTLIALEVPFWPVLMVPHGFLLVFLFTLQHEATHETAFATPWLNRWVSRFIGFLIVMPPLWFRYFHFAHHRHTQDADNDPELEGGKPETLKAYLFHISGFPLWWSMGKTLAKNAFGQTTYSYVPTKAQKKITAEARILLALYAGLFLASLAFQTTHLLFVWIVPLLLGQPFLRLYLLAEHGRCAFISDMLENTRTTYTNRLVRWIAWNMPYHAEHHTMPTVPFHKLPALNALTKRYLKTTAPGYRAFNRSYVDAVRRKTA